MLKEGCKMEVQKVNIDDKQRILILEDDEDLAEGISLSLNSNELDFILCKTIAEAKSILQQKAFDLLILDINLPDGSGLELCREIRRSSRIPIALLTAKDMELDIVKGLECGADDYITKPFSLMVLRARVRALLRRNTERQKSEYKNKVFQFCFDTMKFYKEGNFIELSKTEQRILYLLVFNEGQIITRERLLGWVWPDGTEYVEDNALSVGIRRLRDKIGGYTVKTCLHQNCIWKRLYVGEILMKGYILLLVIAVVVCAGICLLVKRYYQSKMETALQELLEKLDRAIGGEVQEAVYDESMDAAIVERLNRMVEIYEMNLDKAERERDIIKSLISDVSHQVRTPLTDIMLYVGLLQEQELGRL
jgi:DNA-binding response OmpR family regulator